MEQMRSRGHKTKTVKGTLGEVKQTGHGRTQLHGGDGPPVVSASWN